MSHTGSADEFAEFFLKQVENIRKWTSSTDPPSYKMANDLPIDTFFLTKHASFTYSHGLVRFCDPVCICGKIVSTGYTLAKTKHVNSDVCRF